jgi:hypothetical protein
MIHRLLLQSVVIVYLSFSRELLVTAVRSDESSAQRQSLNLTAGHLSDLGVSKAGLVRSSVIRHFQKEEAMKAFVYRFPINPGDKLESEAKQKGEFEVSQAK